MSALPKETSSLTDELAKVRAAISKLDAEDHDDEGTIARMDTGIAAQQAGPHYRGGSSEDMTDVLTDGRIAQKLAHDAAPYLGLNRHWSAAYGEQAPQAHRAVLSPTATRLAAQLCNVRVLS